MSPQPRRKLARLKRAVDKIGTPPPEPVCSPLQPADNRLNSPVEGSLR